MVIAEHSRELSVLVSLWEKKQREEARFHQVAGTRHDLE